VRSGFTERARGYCAKLALMAAGISLGFCGGQLLLKNGTIPKLVEAHPWLLSAAFMLSILFMVVAPLMIAGIQIVVRLLRYRKDRIRHDRSLDLTFSVKGK